MAGVALVTGGGRGIGRAICDALAEADHPVAVADLDADGAHTAAQEIASRGGPTLAVGLDVTDTRSVAEGVRRVADELGPVDVLVNNAGYDELRPFVDTDEEFWARIIEINFKGCLRLCHAVIPGMLERRRGRVVNIGSDAGRVGSSLESVYAGAKGAVIAFTKTLAREVARSGVTANCVCPGPTDTPMLQGMAAEQGGGSRLIDALTRAVPMRRLGQPEEAAAAVAFLASEQASFITGQTLSVSGGLTMA
ncbi:MAG: SDR family oxidoreductase [Actinobacteria bacterium]|nr:MAG: SDR family oxidoreductase [Actinomycetota bacterium]